MKRIQLFEFEDQKWFPEWIRIAITKLLTVMNKAMGVDIAISHLLVPVLRSRAIKSIVDLGSGAGGAMPAVMETIHQEDGMSDISLTLTDLYPNSEAIARAGSMDHISYHPDPVDATDLSSAPQGIKTMVNAFHHLPPTQAKALLNTAAVNKQPLLIFEMANNNIPTIAWAIFLPLGLVLVFFMAWLFTPFSKPSLKQLFFTYIIPIIPICYAWDGQASFPRIYASEDIDELISDIEVDGYQWTKGSGAGKNGKKVGNYLMGMPI